MNLDDLEIMRALDVRDMLSAIDGLPEQLLSGWELGQQQLLPAFTGIRQVIIAGVGGSAIGADLFASYAAPLCRVPIFVYRNYGLPAWAVEKSTLAVLCSHSGETEEILDAFRAAVANDCQILAITTGGALAEQALSAGAALWKFTHAGQPRAAVGFSFGLLLAAFHRLGLLPDPRSELDESVAVLRQQRQSFTAAAPVFRNPAKRMAGQLMGRWVVIFSSDHLEPVARRWKGQISELAKAWAQFEFLPEADHNSLAGLFNPPALPDQMMALFIRGESTHPRNRLRADMTREACMVSGMNTDFFDAPGQGRMAQIWSALQFGDYMAYYLAIAYGEDPTQVEIFDQLKQALRDNDAG